MATKEGDHEAAPLIGNDGVKPENVVDVFEELKKQGRLVPEDDSSWCSCNWNLLHPSTPSGALKSHRRYVVKRLATLKDSFKRGRGPGWQKANLAGSAPPDGDDSGEAAAAAEAEEEEPEPAPECTGRCAAGLATDCAVICCCPPLVFLYLVAMGWKLVKLPFLLARRGCGRANRTLRTISVIKLPVSTKKKKSGHRRLKQRDTLRTARKEAPVVTVAHPSSVHPSSCPEPAPLEPAYVGGFGDQAPWRQNFGSDSSKLKDSKTSKSTADAKKRA